MKKGRWENMTKGWWCDDWEFTTDDLDAHTDPSGHTMCDIPKKDHVRAKVQIWVKGKK